MIPVDIDNFNVKILLVAPFENPIGISIKYYSFEKIPKEIGNCSSLDQLYLSNYTIVDISAISNLTSLTRINLAYNKIVDISPLSNLISLKYLYLDNNKIVDISALANLTSARSIFTRYNKIKTKIKYPKINIYY